MLAAALAAAFSISAVSAKCGQGEFSCASGDKDCVPIAYRCDGDADCGDGSDEVDCSCPEGRFKCPGQSRHRCFPLSFICDGNQECADGFDEEEENCALKYNGTKSLRRRSRPLDRLRQNPACSIIDGFDCGEGARRPCVPRRFRCDGDNDCGNGNDEKDCDAATCKTGHFACGDGGRRSCVPNSYKCDGDNDCGNGADEADEACSCKAGEEFDCGRGSRRRCIPKRFHCDGDNDCGNGKDERGCPPITPPPLLSSECGRLEGEGPSPDSSAVRPGQWPWLLSIRRLSPHFDMDHSCGAVLIAPDTLLTAKHCFVDKKVASLRVSIEITAKPLYMRVHQGAHGSSTLAPQEAIVSIRDIYPIPKSSPAKNADIAVVKLRRPIAPPNATICLPTKEDEDDFSDCWFAGWGQCGMYGDFSGPPTQTPVRVTNASDISCYLNFLRSRPRGSRICVRGQREDRPFCFGDSGGPLMCRSRSTRRWRVAATLAGGKGICASEKRTVFENVVYHRKFILSRLNLPSYYGSRQSPLPPLPERPDVAFRAECSSREEVFRACVAPDGKELKEGGSWTDAGFLYRCNFPSPNRAIFKAFNCVVDGRRLSKGEEFVSGYFRHRCVEEEEIKDQWMRKKIIACWDPRLSQAVPRGGNFEAEDGGKLTCWIGFRGYIGEVRSSGGDHIIIANTTSGVSRVDNQASIRTK